MKTESAEYRLNRYKQSLLRMLLCGLFLMTGCGYAVGPMHDPQIRSVHVPIFESQLYRRGMEYQLTEAVQKAILERTPYRLAKGPNADTRLTGRILELRKNVLGENRYDDPRELQVALAVEVTWVNLQTGRVIAQQQFSLPSRLVHLESQASFAPELGHSLATAEHDAVNQLAEQITNLMEIPW